MTTEQYDIKTNIKIGREIFENIPNHVRPGWAGLVLSRFDHYIKNIPTSISELYPIIDDIDRWKEAHEQFTKIRVFGLENKNYEPENYLRLAELVAKVTYSHREVVLENDRFSSVLLTRRKTQAMQRIGEDLQRSQRDGGKSSNSKTTSRWLYNASGQSAPFDSDSGHHIASLALKATAYFDDNTLEEEVKSAIHKQYAIQY